MTNWLDAGRIAGDLGDSFAGRLHSLQVLSEVDSTNSYLLREGPPPTGLFRVVLAEQQTGGRGQLGRTWESVPRGSICLSLAYTFAIDTTLQPSLSLAIGATVARGLAGLGVRNVGVKWPNDIIAMDGKLGGVLIESRVPTLRNPSIVVGVGLNLDMGNALDHLLPASTVGKISDVRQCATTEISATRLASTLVDSLARSVLLFEEKGFGSFAALWHEFDWLRGREVCIDSSAPHISGTAVGVDPAGALLVQTEQGVVPVSSGSISLPMQQDVVA